MSSNSATINTNRLVRAYGEIYTHDNEIGQSIPVGTTYTKLCPITSSLGSVKNCTLDGVACNIVIGVTGMYEVVFTATSKVNSNQVTLRTVVFKNDAELDNIHGKRVIKLASEESTVQIEGLVRCEVGDTIDVRVRHSNGSPVILTNEYANLNVNRIDI